MLHRGRKNIYALQWVENGTESAKIPMEPANPPEPPEYLSAEMARWWRAMFWRVIDPAFKISCCLPNSRDFCAGAGFQSLQGRRTAQRQFGAFCDARLGQRGLGIAQEERLRERRDSGWSGFSGAPREWVRARGVGIRDVQSANLTFVSCNSVVLRRSVREIHEALSLRM
jgi:hypothetical protein